MPLHGPVGGCYGFAGQRPRKEARPCPPCSTIRVGVVTYSGAGVAEFPLTEITSTIAGQPSAGLKELRAYLDGLETAGGDADVPGGVAAAVSMLRSAARSDSRPNPASWPAIPRRPVISTVQPETPAATPTARKPRHHGPKTTTPPRSLGSAVREPWGRSRLQPAG